MIYLAKIFTKAAIDDGKDFQQAGAVMVFADNQQSAYNKAEEHWADFTQSLYVSGSEHVIQVLAGEEVEAILP